MNPYNKPNREKDFSKISSVDDMIEYLDDPADRVKNRKYLYHYAKIQRVIDIFGSKKTAFEQRLLYKRSIGVCKRRSEKMEKR